MSEKINVRGFVLKKKNLINDDLLVVILSRELGKIAVMAKGARKAKSRRAPYLQTGNLINAIIYQKYDMYFLLQTDLVSAFSQIRDSLSMSYLYQFLFTIEGILPQNEKEEKIFNLLQNYIISLHKKENHEVYLKKFLTLLLSQLGYIDGSDKIDDIYKLAEEVVGRPLPKHAIISSYEK
jgi:DNA repair protein RecO (recombination protein O)